MTTSRTKKGPKLSRLSRGMTVMAEDMHMLGIMDDAGYAKITMR